uniref:Alpha/beta hydrolase fold n=1 Tax=Solibacter usitatus (strain Ellin6076) TaxID=234267 RepID=Q02BB5_SOLUE
MKRAAVVIVALVLVGIIYEQVGERRDRMRYPQIGRSVDIGGRTLNIYCSGEGSPTVIFEGAGHTAGYAWTAMQVEAAKLTRACWYDRAGYGWSDPGPSPRTFKAIGNDLHALLRAAALPPPYVLVGATAGAFHVRVYNGLYPGEVAGAVLIHAADPDVFAHEPEFMKGSLAGLPPLVQRAGCKVLQPVMLRLGLLRLMGNPGGGRPFGLANLTQPQRQELMFLSNNPRTTQTEGEGCVLEESMAEVRAAGDFGNRPLYVLAGSTPFRSPEPRYAKATEALNNYWFHELQPRLAALSTRGHLIIEEHAERPDAVTEAVRNVVTEVRAEQQKRL